MKRYAERYFPSEKSCRMVPDENGEWVRKPDIFAATYVRADLAVPSAHAKVEGLVKRLLSKTPNMVEGHKAMEDAATALTALQADNERLREALTEIANAYTAHGYSDAMDAVQHLKSIAKEAING